MDDLESLAVKEIIKEIERKKRIELESRRPAERKIRPNNRFLGRTIRSVLQHNKRKHAEERRNSTRKLKELNRGRRRSRSRSKNREQNQKRSRARPQQVGTEVYPNELPMNLAMYLGNLSNINDLLKGNQKVSRKKKVKSDLFTIDLTKKTKRTKEKKKNKARQKKIKSKKRRRRKDSSSSSSSFSSSSRDSSVCAVSDCSLNGANHDQTSTLLIDLT